MTSIIACYYVFLDNIYAETNLYEDFCDSSSSKVKPSNGNPIYDSTDIPNPIYSSAGGSMGGEGEGYDQLQHHNSKRAKPEQDYSKLGPSILHPVNGASGYVDHGNDNVHTNNIYGCIDEPPAKTGFQNTGFNSENYDSLDRTPFSPPQNTSGNQNYDHLESPNSSSPAAVIEDEYAVVMKKPKGNQNPSTGVQKPNIVINDTYDSLDHASSSTGNVTVNDVYDSLDHTGQPQPSAGNNSYDSLQKQPDNSNVVVNDVYDSRHPERKERGNSNVMMNDTYGSLEGVCATPNVMVNDTYDSLQHPIPTSLISPIIYDSIQQPPPQAPSFSPSDLMSSLSDNEYNSLHQTIVNNQPNYDHLSSGKERKPRGPSFGKAKDYSRLEDEYATPNVIGFAHPEKGKKNNEKKKKKSK